MDAKEFELQRKQLHTPVGEAGSGYMRYSAAMYFHKAGKLSLELLEIYRRCCKFDNEDPREVAAGILAVADRLTIADTGKFFRFTGEERAF